MVNPIRNKLPTDEGHGYIWRLYSLTKFEERDGGVYIEVESNCVESGYFSITPVVHEAGC